MTKYPTGVITTASPWGGVPYGVPWRAIAQWAASIEHWAAYYRVPEWVIIAIIVIESQGDETAYRPGDSYDQWPATGLMQVKAHYWRSLIIGPASASDADAIAYLRHGDGAIQLGTAVMADGIRRFGDWQSSIRKQYFPGNDAATGTTQTKYINTMLGIKAELDGVAASGGGSSEGETNVVKIGNRKVRVAIGAGHANNDGGNSYELGLNQKCTNTLLKALRADGRFDVRCYTPNEGLGMFPGGLYAAADVVNDWAAEGWVADILHEIHHEGTGTPSIRGGFVIYPDSAGLYQPNQQTGDIDTDVRDYGGEMARLIVKQYGGVVRGDGTMSERETGVGAQGYRLGVFGAWSETDIFINNGFRLISEAATYTNDQDLPLMKAPDYPAAHARGIIAAYDYLLKQASDWSYKGAVDVPPASVKLYPITAQLPALVNNILFWPVPQTDAWKAQETVSGRQYAAPDATVVETYKPGTEVRFNAVTVGGDNKLWGVTAAGVRLPLTSFATAALVTNPLPTLPVPGTPAVVVPPPLGEGQSGMSGIEADMLKLINKYRKRSGKAALTWENKLSASSQWFADDMAATKSFSYEHIDSKGRRWRPRLDSFGFTNKVAGENIGWGYTAQDMLTEFINSPPHNENLLNGKFTRIGVGYAPGTGDSGVRKVWVLDFGGES